MPQYIIVIDDIFYLVPGEMITPKIKAVMDENVGESYNFFNVNIDIGLEEYLTDDIFEEIISQPQVKEKMVKYDIDKANIPISWGERREDGCADCVNSCGNGLDLDMCSLPAVYKCS